MTTNFFTRRRRVLTLAMLVLFGFVSQAFSAERPPNVVLVMTDDQGYGDVGALGNKLMQTPTLDRFHAQSVRFTSFHVDPTCAETRSALMTGRYSTRVGVWHTIMGRSILRRNETTMAQVFAASGYATGMFGKWHLGDSYPYTPEFRGFQRVVRLGGGGVIQTPDYWGNTYFDDTYWADGKPTKYEGYCTDVFFNEALQFIEKNKDRPFFCYLPTNAAHGPYNVADKYSDIYHQKGVKGPKANFWGMITNIDENFDRLLKKLDELRLADNTIVIFMTDNGTAAGDDGGMRGRKGSEYEGGHRVPCFIRWPKGGVGGDAAHARDVNAIAAHFDLLPTFIEVCGLKQPSVQFDGRSLAPLLTGKGDTDWPARTLFVHSQRVNVPIKWRKCSVMTDQWRLVDGKELYDIHADPAQKNDIAAMHADVVGRLRQSYEGWWSSISESFDGFSYLDIGAPQEVETRLTAHDWLEGNGPTPWNQGMIRSGVIANGRWAINVVRDGKYRFELRRWPRPEDGPIESTHARVKISGVDVNADVNAKDKYAEFIVDLKAGETFLETWLTDAKTNKTRGAYFVYVKRVE